jgi:hypothetical protein
MVNDSENDTNGLWEEQPREAQRISLDEIHAKAHRFETRTRRWRTVGSGVIVVAVIANIVEALWPGQNIMERAGDLLTVAAFFYIAYEYWTHGRFAWRPEGLGLTDCVEFYRAHLIHERNLARQSSRYLLPFVPGVTLSLLSGVLEGVPTSRLIVFAALGVALFLGVAWWNARTARKLQKEIDALRTS